MITNNKRNLFSGLLATFAFLGMSANAHARSQSVNCFTVATQIKAWGCATPDSVSGSTLTYSCLEQDQGEYVIVKYTATQNDIFSWSCTQSITPVYAN